MRFRTRPLVALAVAVLVTVAVATGVSLAAAPSQGVTDYLAYTGGKKSQASGKKPIVIGWINQQGGPLPSFIAATKAIIAGTIFVNKELNGIHGQPVKLHTCYIGGTEEEGKKCGLEMANDPNVKVIIFGAVTVGNQSIYATIKGKKPIVIGVSASPVDGNQKNVYALNGDQPHVLGPWGTFGRDVLKAKTAAVINENLPGAIPAAAATQKGLEDAGIKVTHVQFDANLTDLLGPLTAANVTKVDMVVPSIGFPYCVNFVKALQQTGSTKPVVSLPLCTFIPPAAYPGGDYPKWMFGFAQANTAFTPPQADVKAYLDTSAKYGLGPVDQQNVFSSIAWAELLAVVKVMNAIPAKKITAATISAGLKSFRGPVVMGPPSVQCGFDKTAIAICNNQTHFDQYLGGGKWKVMSGWLKPPK
jgi:branched-chain amino acid transport system substrate-binding protein